MGELRPDERTFLEQHSLKKPLRVLDIWALGVGAVISGEYFGWNLGLKDSGPVAMLAASFVVCLLYLTWVLALTELSVAMPFAGGPLAYGRRAAGPWLGFVMGWSMLLESQFAKVAIALAVGGYVAFLFDPEEPSRAVELAAALGMIVVFFVLHAWGVKEQSLAMMLMTYAAILGLVLFWAAAATSFSWQRVWAGPLVERRDGWGAVLKAMPYALWWLVMIEAVALASEEAHEPHRTLPRGLVWAQLTLIALVVLTWLFACGAMPYQELAEDTLPDGQTQPVNYPLAKAIRPILLGRAPWLLYAFGFLALFGLVASYHGIVFGTSRQLFALGRAGYLPAWLGGVHGRRRTPVAALAATSLVTAAFVVAAAWAREAIDVAVLVSTLTALVWYVLAVGCLFVLRRREPGLFRNYRAPLHRVLPVTVVLLSAFAVYVYGLANVQVVPLTVLLYVLGLAYFGLVARGRIRKAAPEELAVRNRTLIGEEGAR